MQLQGSPVDVSHANASKANALHNVAWVEDKHFAVCILLDLVLTSLAEICMRALRGVTRPGPGLRLVPVHDAQSDSVNNA